jgi:myo-inositol-1(or 4)-monophosphatase
MKNSDQVSAGVLAALDAAADAVVEALEHQQEWGLTGAGHNQYEHDRVADAAILGPLLDAGFGVFSEESGLHHPERPVLVVVDPVDGSTNASRGLPWWAISLCALDDAGPLAAVVASPMTGERFDAVRGGGARRNGQTVKPAAATQLAQSIVAFNGYPSRHYGWSQYRALGAAALDLCAVACGEVDGFVDCSPGCLAPWDYLGGLLVCQEAGAPVAEAFGRELVVRSPGERRAVVAACTPELLERLVESRVRQH